MCADADVFIVRFEEIIGPEGGGSLEDQKKLIINLSEKLCVELSDEKLNYIQANLYGTKVGPRQPKENFFKGQIGSWKIYFKDEHKRIFNEKWGYYQLALGYPLAE